MTRDYATEEHVKIARDFMERNPHLQEELETVRLINPEIGYFWAVNRVWRKATLFGENFNTECDIQHRTWTGDMDYKDQGNISIVFRKEDEEAVEELLKKVLIIRNPDRHK